MPSLQWKGKKGDLAYAVFYSTVNGKQKAEWRPLGRFKRQADGKQAYYNFLQLRDKRVSKIALLEDFLPIYEQWAKTVKGKVTLDVERRHLLVIKREFGHLRLDQITAELIIDFQKRHEGWKKTTMRNRLGLLKQVMDLARDSNYSMASPYPFKVAKVPAPQIYEFEAGAVDPAWIEEFIECARVTEPRFFPAIMILKHTGLRTAELFRLKPGNIDRENLVLNLESWMTKTKRARAVTFEAELLPYFQCIPLRFDHHALNRAFNRVCKRIEKPNAITPYTLRHQFGTDLLNDGVGIRTVQDLMGHTDIRMTARYAHPNIQNKRAATARLYSAKACSPPQPAEPSSPKTPESPTAPEIAQR